MPLSMTRSDLQQLPDGEFPSWLVRYSGETSSFEAGPGKVKKQQDALYDADGNKYNFADTDYIDRLRIFHGDQTELVLFNNKKDFLEGLCLFSQIIYQMTFKTPSPSAGPPSTGSDSDVNALINLLEGGFSAIAPLAEVAAGGHITLDVATTKALTTPTEKWVLEMSSDPCEVAHAGVGTVTYSADTLVSSETGTVYSAYEKLEEGFVLWGNVHDDLLCIFEDQKNFVKGISFCNSMFTFDLDEPPADLKQLLAEYS